MRLIRNSSGRKISEKELVFKPKENPEDCILDNKVNEIVEMLVEEERVAERKK